MNAWMRMVQPLTNIKSVLWLVAVLGVCAGVTANNRDKYLPAAGPVPLRFRAETPEFNPEWILGPLQMSDAAVTNKPPENVEPKENISAATENGPANQVSEASEQIEIARFEPSEAKVDGLALPKESARNSAGPISPQMFLKYFSRNGTNEVLVPYPLEFTPPVPTRTAESTAVYVSE
jgi:hypothetical protein